MSAVEWPSAVAEEQRRGIVKGVSDWWPPPGKLAEGGSVGVSQCELGVFSEVPPFFFSFYNKSINLNLIFSWLLIIGFM